MPMPNAALGPSRTVKVAMRKRRSPSSSGTSFRTAMANEKGRTNSVSATIGHGNCLDPPLRDGQTGGQDSAADHQAPSCAQAEPAVRDGQPWLVDAIDLDVLALVEADYVDVDRSTREQRQGEVGEAVAEGHSRQHGGGDHVDPQDADRRAHE